MFGSLYAESTESTECVIAYDGVQYLGPQLGEPFKQVCKSVLI